MKIYNSFFLIFILSIFVVTSCTEDYDRIIDTVDNIPEPEQKIFASFSGLILSETNAPVDAANITIGDEQTISDENGFFSISGFFNPSGSYIIVKKDQYYDGTGIVIPHLDANVQIQIVLIEKSNSISESADKVININNNSVNVTLDANSIVDQNGDKYSGMVDIYTTSTSPLEDNFSQRYSGSLESRDNDIAKIIVPYGIVEIEIFGSSNQQLNIDVNASITLDLSPEQLSNAPSKVSLWYLDKASGYWVEEGSAILENGQYIGEVSHFSTWVLGLGLVYHSLSGSVTRDEMPLINANVGIVKFGWFRTSTLADQNGDYTLKVSEGSGYDLNVWSKCQKAIFELLNNPPPSQDEIIDIIVDQTPTSLTVTGTVTCEGQPVDNSYIIAYFEESDYVEVITPDQDGDFEYLFEDCGLTRAQLTAFDIENETRSNPVAVATSGVQDLEVCEAAFTGELIFEIDGEEPYIITNCFVTITDANVPLLPGLKIYTFRSVDRFLNDLNIIDESAEYEIIIPYREEYPHGPVGPVTSPVTLTEGAPFIYYFAPAPFEIDLSDQDKVSVVISEPAFFNKNMRSSDIAVTGTIRINALIQ